MAVSPRRPARLTLRATAIAPRREPRITPRPSPIKPRRPSRLTPRQSPFPFPSVAYTAPEHIANPEPPLDDERFN